MENPKTHQHSPTPKVAVIGAGPAGLMAATLLAQAGVRVYLYDKRPKPGRKLLIAGASGLNIAAQSSMQEHLSILGDGAELLKPALHSFPTEAWIAFIEKTLNLSTFLGTSGRYFVKDMKAANLLSRWMSHLEGMGVEFVGNSEVAEFSKCDEKWAEKIAVKFSAKHGTESQRAEPQNFDGLILALGGAAWEPTDEAPAWTTVLKSAKIEVTDFVSSNCGFHVAEWNEALVAEADRLPLKGVALKTTRGEKMGDLLITSYGLEGTPLYWVGLEGSATLDLLPHMSVSQILSQLKKVKENMSPIRRAQKTLKLCGAAHALIHHTHATGKAPTDLDLFAKSLKQWPLTLTTRRPLTEAISSSGGVALTELQPDLSLKTNPMVFLAGEMLDWDAPTGGYLIHTSVATGHYAGAGLIQRLKQKNLLPLDPGCLA